MREEFTKLQNKKHINMIAVCLIGLVLLNFMCLEGTDRFKSSDTKFSWKNIFMGTIDIEPGTDLTRYEGRKVRCTFHFVLESNDPYMTVDEIGSPGNAYKYTVLDDNLKNPFLIFVNDNKKATMDRMMKETRQILNGEIPYCRSTSMTVSGYVIKASHRSECFIDDSNAKMGETSSIEAGLNYFMFLLGVLVNVSVISVMFANKIQRQYKKFIKEHNITEDEINKEFQRAKKLSQSIYVTDDYTFIDTFPGFIVMANREIVWLYMEIHTINDSEFPNLVFYTLNKTKYSTSSTEKRMKYNEILIFYEQNFSNIVIGKDEDKLKLFQRDFDTFLNLRYNPYLEKYNQLEPWQMFTQTDTLGKSNT